jgi:hypothetical protein
MTKRATIHSSVQTGYAPSFGYRADERHMNATQYTRKLRRIGVISMLIAGVAAAGLVSFRIIPNEDVVPLIAVFIGFLPMAVYMIGNKPLCEKCQGVMRIKAGFPTIVYRCNRCSITVDTEIHSDY